jgi:probable HAF family extracellular repeat protein
MARLFSPAALRREPPQDRRAAAGRRWRHRARLLTGVLALLGGTALGPLSPGASAAVAAPAVTDLGTLGGTNSQATAVSGTIVVGYSDTASGQTHAFAYNLGATTPAMRDLGTLGGTSSQATAVSGTIVVGYSTTATGDIHAFAYNLAAAFPAMLDLGTLGGGTFSRALAVSGNIVVGDSEMADGADRAFVYDLGAASPAMIDLGTLGGTNSESSALAVSGNMVVGYSGAATNVTHAFAYDLGAASPAMQDLGTLAGLGGTYSEALAVSGRIHLLGEPAWVGADRHRAGDRRHARRHGQPGRPGPREHGGRAGAGGCAERYRHQPAGREPDAGHPGHGGGGPLHRLTDRDRGHFPPLAQASYIWSPRA